MHDGTYVICNHTKLRVFSRGSQIYPDFSLHKKDCLKECFEFSIFSALKIHAVCETGKQDLIL